MITVTVVKTDKLQLILTGTDDLDKAILAELNGSVCSLLERNSIVLEKDFPDGGILIQKKPAVSETKKVTWPVYNPFRRALKLFL